MSCFSDLMSTPKDSCGVELDRVIPLTGNDEQSKLGISAAGASSLSSPSPNIDQGVTAPQQTSCLDDEIGRASCRERV